MQANKHTDEILFMAHVPLPTVKVPALWAELTCCGFTGSFRQEAKKP